MELLLSQKFRKTSFMFSSLSFFFFFLKIKLLFVSSCAEFINYLSLFMYDLTGKEYALALKLFLKLVLVRIP